LGPRQARPRQAIFVVPFGQCPKSGVPVLHGCHWESLSCEVIGNIYLPCMNDQPPSQVMTCPRCRQAMKFVRSIPKTVQLLELHIFVCPDCGEVETKEVEQAA
jgi:hypothetical protein